MKKFEEETIEILNRLKELEKNPEIYNVLADTIKSVDTKAYKLFICKKENLKNNDEIKQKRNKKLKQVEKLGNPLGKEPEDTDKDSLGKEDRKNGKGR